MIKAEFYDLGPHNGMAEPDPSGSYRAFTIIDEGYAGDMPQQLTFLVPSHQLPADLATAQVAAAYERAAELVAPNGERPCDCDGCYCGNPGDNAAVSEWDASHHDAQAIRALATSDQTDALEAVKLEAWNAAIEAAQGHLRHATDLAEAVDRVASIKKEPENE